MHHSQLLTASHATRIACALVVAAIAILWIGAYTDLDRALADAMFDPLARRFPWRHAWWAERFAHEIVKQVLTAIGVGAMVATAWDLMSRNRLPPWWRLRLRIIALSALLVPLAIALLKQASGSHCPWDLEIYGGVQPYVRLLDPMPAGVKAGHCLPGGHVSSALWMVSFCVFWLPHRPRVAFACAAGMLAFGFELGWVQQLRGAHFLTHTLWSMWIASAIIAGLMAGSGKLARYTAQEN